MTPVGVARVFLDANVLFSAAYREESGLARLWKLPRCRLLSSALAFEEAHRNLDTAARRERLGRLRDGVEIVPEVAAPPGKDWGLRAKDIPILAAAIAAGATHLLTGDVRDFGPLLGRRVGGVRIQRPAEFLREV